MATSLNGWPVLVPTSKLLRTDTVPLTTRKIRMRKDILPLFLALAFDYHDWIRPIDKGSFDDAGYVYRKSRAINLWSNHASGTALDINWAKEGAQVAANRRFWAKPENIAAIKRIKRVYKVITWGGDWSPKYWDPMHFEITRGVSRKEVLERIEYLDIRYHGVRFNGQSGKPMRKPRGK